jgi:hypothetical protein
MASFVAIPSAQLSTAPAVHHGRRPSTARIAQDENLHYVFYRDVCAAALEVDPSPVVMAMQRQVLSFAMPSAGIPGFGERAKGMADAGVYDLRLHHDQVLSPVLKHWRIQQLSGLSAEAEVARDRLIAFVAKVDRAASRFEESLVIRRFQRVFGGVNITPGSPECRVRAREGQVAYGSTPTGRAIHDDARQSANRQRVVNRQSSIENR